MAAFLNNVYGYLLLWGEFLYCNLSSNLISYKSDICIPYKYLYTEPVTNILYLSGYINPKVTNNFSI